MIKLFKQILHVAGRECRILRSNAMYLLCMIVFPLATTVFFTSILHEGQPADMPVGIVDLDNTSTTRSLVRTLDAFQTTRVAAHYNSVGEARQAMQRDEIYAFLYIPEGTTDKLLAMRQPKISFYYSNAVITAGSLLFRDLKTIATLGSASVGKAAMSAKGYTEKQIETLLQPIALDLHPLNNPSVNYNVYLSTTLIPGCLLLFFFLVSAYSIGTELKFGRSKEWLAEADNNIAVALLGKMLPQFLVFISVFFIYEFYVFYILEFPHAGGVGKILLLGLLSVLAAQGFGIFAFGLMPSLRMSMSICSLWAALSFSAVGTTFPLFAMDSAIRAMAQLFPLRHYFVLYKTCVFNGFPVAYAWMNVAALAAFAALPLTVLPRIRKAMLEYTYIP